MTDLMQDLTVGLRGLVRRPGFTLMAVATLALGIGVTTSMFSVVNGVLLRPLPYDHPDRILVVYSTEADGRDSAWSGANFLDLMEQSTVYEALVGYRIHAFSLNEGEFPGSHRGLAVTNQFFRVFGVDAALGRTISPDADEPGGEPAVVLSHGLWSFLYGQDPSVLGRTLELNGDPYTVVGVMPPGFAFPTSAELWFTSRGRVPDPPFDFGAPPEEIRGADYFSALGRLLPDATVEQAQQEGSLIAAQLEEEYPGTNRGEGLHVRPLQDVLVGSVRPALLVLFGAVGFVLLIACANVANLLLVRASGRRQEVAVRRALGANRKRLTFHFLTESLLLGLLGGGAGLVLSLWGTEVLVSLAASDLPRSGEAGIDTTVLIFTVLVAILSGLLFGLAPLLQASGASPAAVLRQANGRHGEGRGGRRLRTALIVGEIAISVVLLVGAGLLIRTLAAVGSADPGFTARDVLTARVFVPANKYPENEQLWQFYGEVLENVKALPGVRSAAGVLSLPISEGVGAELSFIVRGHTYEEGNEPVAGYQAATPGYFQIMGIPLLRGRTFTPDDRAGNPQVAVVSQAFAEQIFPDEDPIGQQVSWSDDTEDPDFTWTTIVGVVGNTLHDGLDGPPRSEIYQPFDQEPWPFFTLVVDAQNSEGLAAPLRRVVMQADPLQPVTNIATMRELLHDSLARRRFNMILMSVFAALSLLLAAVGLYGVLSYTVAQRGREIGIRMAVGADARHVVEQFLGEGLRLIGGGILIGIAGSLALSRLIAGLVHGVRPLDPVSFAGGIAALGLIALVACWVPARRAARTDPMATLRRE